jgi:hypothetical protein
VNNHLIDSHRECGIVCRFVQKVHAQFDQQFVKRWNSIRIQNVGLSNPNERQQGFIFDILFIVDDAMGSGQDFSGANQRSTAGQLVSP